MTDIEPAAQPSTAPLDLVLLRCTLTDASGLVTAATDWCAASAPQLALHRAAWSREKQLAYVYGRVLPVAPPKPIEPTPLAVLWARCCPLATAIELRRLSPLFDAPGASFGQTASFHYAVETDAKDGQIDEIGRWYDTEHMPGLAAVPGCIHARRLANCDGGPYSFACYDLTEAETLNSAAWLAVRGTAWSDRARPLFTNTRRTMMQVLA